MPLNSAYGGAHVHVTNMIHHVDDHDHEPSPNHFQQVPSSNGPSIAMAMTQNHEHHHEHVMNPNGNKKQVIRYRECLKNHAASMGGNATDGCGEFMPSGEEGTIEALACSACNCHRNFHRKEVEGEISSSSPTYHHHLMINSRGRKVINLSHHKNMLSSPVVEAFGGYPTAGALVPSSGGPPRSVPIIPYNIGSLMIKSDQSDDQEEGPGANGGVACRALPPPPPHHHQYYIHHSNHHHDQMLKKRFRTKFTPDQKEKMLSFAQKVGWKIQKQEDSVVQQFCQEIGVKRRVLKVWMHNNKHNLAKKNSLTPDVGV